MCSPFAKEHNNFNSYRITSQAYRLRSNVSLMDLMDRLIEEWV
ncbi:Uncharacterised protein [Vibrio cholerae]|nr:Uncharacterised protein [Vibrio cholerae]